MTHTLSDDIINHIPPYLLPENKEDLFKEIKKFPNINYYTNKYPSKILQGDGWSDFTVLNFDSGDKKQVRGVILSNSCDVDIENHRDQVINIIFVPLIKLEKYESLLVSSGISKDRINSKIDMIKQQKITSIMYFPSGAGLDADYIANLDDIHSQPLQLFGSGDKVKLFTLSQAGFYVFVLKLSIHFCRFQEGIFRNG